MAQKPSIPKGTRDFSPAEVAKRNYIFSIIKSNFEKFGFQPIETPSFENSETLMGKYGEEGDRLIFKILNSGDYLAKADATHLENKDSLKLTSQISEKALRYDLTVPFARYVVQHQNEIEFPFKRYQIQPVWRADRPQKGRQRQFHQINFEIFGEASLFCDVEAILLANGILRNLGVLDNVTLEINSLGCPQTKTDYEAALVEYFTKFKDDLSNDSQNRLEKNPLRILDSKDPKDIELLGDAPKISNFFTEEAKSRFAEILALLDKFGVKYHVNERLVRGLDYYTSTVFEFVMSSGSAQNTVLAGGRYDGLVEKMGGKEMPAIGFAAGIERLALITDLEIEKARPIAVNYISENEKIYA